MYALKIQRGLAYLWVGGIVKNAEQLFSSSIMILFQS